MNYEEILALYDALIATEGASYSNMKNIFEEGTNSLGAFTGSHGGESLFAMTIDGYLEDYEDQVGKPDGAEKITALNLRHIESLNARLETIREHLKENPDDAEAKKYESKVVSSIQFLKSRAANAIKQANSSGQLMGKLSAKYKKLLDETNELISKYSESGLDADKVAAKNKLLELQKTTKSDEAKVKNDSTASKFIDKVKAFTAKAYAKLNHGKKPKTA